MLFTDREILGETFHEPERRIHLRQILQAGAGTTTRKNVELEHVHHFVHEHVLEAGPVAAEELRHALAQGVGHTAGAFSEIAEHIALRKIARRAEDEYRLLLAKLVGHEAR